MIKFSNLGIVIKIPISDIFFFFFSKEIIELIFSRSMERKVIQNFGEGNLRYIYFILIPFLQLRS